MPAVHKGGLPDLADRLNFLFRYIPDPDGKQMSNHQAAEFLLDDNVSVSGTYISQLRSGARQNPSAVVIGGLAKLFGVRVDYFFDDTVAETTQNEVRAVTALRDKHVRGVLARSGGVTEEGFTRALQRAAQELQQDEEDHRDDDSPDQDRRQR